MNRLQYTIEINAPAREVYRAMLGLDDKSTYEQWASAFGPSSTYRGEWHTSNKIYFVGTDEDGNEGGMISKVVVHVPNEYLSLENVGFINNSEEVTTGPEVEEWLGGHENYRFVEESGRTTVTVEVEVPDDHVFYFNEAYPLGLERLKRLVEK